MKCTCPGWYGTKYPWPHHPDCPLAQKKKRERRNLNEQR